ncbi:Transcription termination factor MTEF18, mitochondrial [Linum grandiflorum]
MPISKPLCSILRRHFSSLPKLPASASNLSKIRLKYRRRLIEGAQQALTDYLYATKSLPYTYAEYISKNSTKSLSNLMSNVEISASDDYSKSLRKFLSYHPINELEFFYESLGIDYNEVRGFLPADKFFFSEDGSALGVACALSGFGFPWNKLGMLYKEEMGIFTMSPEEIISRVHKFKGYGFGNTSVIGICMAFPYVLNGELDGEMDALFNDLKIVFVDFDLGSSVEANVDAWFGMCRKLRLFYDLGCEKGKTGEMMGRSKNIFTDFSAEVLTDKIEYFCRLGVEKKEVAILILEKPQLLDFDLGASKVISVQQLLRHFGLSTEQFDSVYELYPHVFGRNKMANLPHVLRAMDLHVWFFDILKNGDHRLLGSYFMSDPAEDLDKEFFDGLERISVSRTPVHTMSKLDFLHGIGFGENALTIKVINFVHGTKKELQERFDCLHNAGIEFSKLCRIIRVMPKILNQSPDIVEKKLEYLCNEMGSSLQYLDQFPAYLNFNLEKRIKPRFRFHLWLVEKGLTCSKYSIGSIVATSEKNFMHRLYGIHPAIPKHWLARSADRELDDEPSA